MKHYVMCPNLFTLQRFIFEVPQYKHGLPHSLELTPDPAFSPLTLPPEPLVRLGLVNTELQILKIVACAFSGYHALKSKFGDLFAARGPWHMSEKVPDILHLTFLRSYADVVSAEAHEFGIATRGFDPESFEEFLVSLENPIEAINDR